MHRFRGTFARLVLVGAVALAAAEAGAQGVTGSAVAGAVKDASGGPAQGEKLQLKNTSNGSVYNAVTDAEGKYFFNNVQAGGPYELTIAPEGYQPIKKEGIQLTLGERLKLDLQLQLAGELVTIEAHTDPLEDKARTGPSTVLHEDNINRIPLQGRNFTDLLTTSPNVAGGSFAGQNSRYNSILIDGGANNDLFGLGNQTPGSVAGGKAISIEAIKEFTVQVAPFDVRLGSFTGGIVNGITKSGTNEFHGSVFGYFQNKSLTNTHAYLTNFGSAGYATDPSYLDYTTVQFGAAVGGPIIKDKLHFFISGDFQQKSQSFGGLTINGLSAADDVSKAGFTVATAQRFADLLAAKGITNAGNAFAPSQSSPDRNVFAKLSTNVIDNSVLELSYNFVKASLDSLSHAPTGPRVAPNALSGGYQLSNSGYSIANTTNTVRAKLTSNLDGGNISNEFLASMSYVRDARDLPTNTPLILVKAVDPANGSPGKLGASDAWLAAGAERFSQGNALDQDVYNIQDNITFGAIRTGLGDHRITVGTSNEYLKLRNLFLQAAYGVYSFDCLNAADCTKSLESGAPSGFERRFSVFDNQEAGTARFGVLQLGAYIQDEWSLARNLTITPGFRVDVPYFSKANRNEVLANNTAFPIDTSKVPNGNFLLSPRVGLNWDVEGNSNTIVRGGGGIFTGRPPYVWLANAYSINGLAQVQLSCFGSTIPTFVADPKAQPTDCTGGTSRPAPPTNPGEIDFFDPGTRYPQTFKVALGVDRRLPFWDVVASLDFLYSKDLNAWYTLDANLKNVGTSGEGRALYGTFNAATGAATPSRVDGVNLGPAVEVFNKSGGQVASATISLLKQFGQQYSINVAYTYSSSRDLISLTSSQALSNFRFEPIDGTMENRNAAPSAFDRPHKITITGTANLAYGFGAGLSYVGQSGTPYTWIVNGDVNGDGQSTNDVPFIPKDPSQISLQDPSQYAALSAFIDSQGCLADARGSLLKRGACRNPWQNFLNARLTWTTPEIKGQHGELQLDIFNLINLLSFGKAGLYEEATGFETHGQTFLKPVGYDTANSRPIYAFTAPTTVTTNVYSATQSRWRMQLGGRYTF